MRILVTGFEPFGNDKRNASWDAVSILPDVIDGAEIIKRELPVSFARVSDELQKLLDELRPNAVLCVGQAAGRTAITPEKVAINWKSASIADNDGVLCESGYLVHNAPAAHFSTLPVEAITAALQAEKIPAYVSYTAGTYVCNATMYALLLLTERLPGVLGGFIHVPYTCEQAANTGQPSLPLKLIAAGLETALRQVIYQL